MEGQDLINILFTLVGGGIGWYIKTLSNAVNDLSDKVQHIEVLVAGKYPTRDELTALAGNLYSLLKEINAKLDRKADK